MSRLFLASCRCDWRHAACGLEPGNKQAVPVHAAPASFGCPSRVEAALDLARH